MSGTESLEAPFEGKRLYEVQIEQTIIVLASDEGEADEIAREQASCGGNIDWNDANYDTCELAHVPADWQKAIPFGMPHGMRDRTCQQIFDAWKEYETARPPTAAELEAMGQQRLI